MPDVSKHPSEDDLVNFAREKIGAKKRQRILDHCKECDACADRLLHLVREHAPEPGPMRLDRWQKISLVLFVLALLAMVAVFWWWVREAEQATSRALREDLPEASPPVEAGPEPGPS